MTPGALLLLAGLQQFALLNRDFKDIAAWAREDTNDAQRQYFLGIAHWKRHEWRETDSLLRLAVSMEPHYADAYLALYYLPYARRTQLWDEQRRNRVPEAWRPIVKEAEDFYARAFRTDPMVSLEILGLAYDLQEAQALDYTLQDYQAYLRYYAWAVDLGQGRYRSAYEHLEKLARQDYGEAKHPENVPNALLLYRGLAAAHTVRYEDALADFRTLLERTRKVQEGDQVIPVPLHDNDYRFMLAAIHHTAGHTDSAIALYQESLEHDLGLVMAHTYLANLYEKSGRADEALLERRRAVEVSSDDPAALFDLGISLFNAGRVGEALDYLYRAIGLNPRYSPPYYVLGRIGEALKQSDDAREQYKQFLARAPLRLADLRTDAQQRLDRLSK
jgi:tetratricopeptide (TPR) repeat protein